MSAAQSFFMVHCLKQFNFKLSPGFIFTLSSLICPDWVVQAQDRLPGSSDSVIQSLPGGSLLKESDEIELKDQTLLLTEAFASAKKHYPSILASQRDVAASQADKLAAQGSWDLKFNAQVRKDPIGYYENDYFETKLEQPTPYWGTSFFGGYRQGNGFFPVYEEKLETLNRGEFFTGIRAPLLKDRAIDRARAGVQQSDTRIDQSKAELALTELSLLTETSLAYWNWVGAGMKFRIYEQLLEITKKRDQGVRDNVQLGQAPQVEIIDNTRLIVQRESQLIAARRYLEQTALKLSIYLRDDSGNPKTPDVEISPEYIPSVEILKLPGPDDSALFWAEFHPEIIAFRKELEWYSIELKVASNQRLPSLNFTATVSRDAGDGSKSDQETEGRFLLEFEFPFLNRKARGKMAATQEKLASLKEKVRLMQDQAFMRIDNTWQAIRASQQRAELSSQELDLALQMQKAELDKVDLGQSNLLLLNLREQASIRASVALIEAKIELLQNLALYQYARGQFEEDWGR